MCIFVINNYLNNDTCLIKRKNIVVTVTTTRLSTCLSYRPSTDFTGEAFYAIFLLNKL